MGKSIDKRIAELGGKRLMELHCADEATNMEEVVEGWKTTIERVLVQSLAPADAAAAAAITTSSGGSAVVAAAEPEEEGIVNT